VLLGISRHAKRKEFQDKSPSLTLLADADKKSPKPSAS